MQLEELRIAVGNVARHLAESGFIAEADELQRLMAIARQSNEASSIALKDLHDRCHITGAC